MKFDHCAVIVTLLMCCGGQAVGVAAQERLPALDLPLTTAPVNPKGIWSDGTTMWVAEGSIAALILYAYDLRTGARDPTKNFYTSEATKHGGGGPRHYIWSDGATMWVSGRARDGTRGGWLYAYDMATKARAPRQGLRYAGRRRERRLGRHVVRRDYDVGRGPA